MKRITAIVYGVGTMGRSITRLMVEKGVSIVGAIDINPEIVGKDLGDVAELGSSLKVPISDDAEAVLSECEADIVVLPLVSLIADLYPHVEKCVRNHHNVITLSRELLYPWDISPVLASKIDHLAKAYDVTVTGTGNGDLLFVNLIGVMTGASHSIRAIRGRLVYDINDYGPNVARDMHVGKTTDEVYGSLKGQAIVPSAFRMGLDALVNDLGLTTKKVVQRTEPTADDVDLKCKSLGIAIPKGQVTGLAEIVELETEEGLAFRGELIGKVCREGESDSSEWSIEGIPNAFLRNDNYNMAVSAAVLLTNRIPDVINSDPGLVTVDKLPKMTYRAFPLQHYLNGGHARRGGALGTAAAD